jgi:5,10-methylenetetrahydromethanopterin reductase
MKISVLFGQQIDRLEPLEQYARLCADRDLRLWTGQSLMIETHAALAALAARGPAVDVGMAVAVAPLRTPYDAFAQARSIATLSGRSVSAAYGMGTAEMARHLLGHPLEKPARYTADYVSRVSALARAAAGDPTAHPDPAELPPYPLASAPIEVGCGVLRPTMARLAGEVADFIVTWLVPLGFLRDRLIPALTVGAAAASRQVPRVVAVLPCALQEPGRDLARLATLACGRHLDQPHYRAMLSAAGVPISDDRAATLRATVRAGVFTGGPMETILRTLADYRAAGVDEVILNAGAVGLVHGHEEALRDLTRTVDAFDTLGTATRRDEGDDDE